ncbi:MAG: serine acetyltransferase [Ferruginibacter sp.]
MLLFFFIKIFHKKLYDVIRYDIYSTYITTDDKVILSAIKRDIEFRILFYFRVAAYFKEHGLLFGSVIYKFYFNLSTRYCITLYPETKIGLGFRIGHIGNIIVHSKSVIGNNVTISQGVTLGKIHTGKKQGTPTLGNNIYIGPNAVIVGNIKIGNDIIISGNAFVNFDVPDNSVVLGNPGVVHHKEKPTAEILNCLT